MTTLREAAQMALDALEQVQEADTAGATPKMVMEARKLYEPTITALLAALAQPEQEPVAWMYNGNLHLFDPSDWADGTVTPLYNFPPQREWQGLTDEERQECLYSDPIFGMAASTFARAIEAKLKEKNGAI
jgi:hypothetical protein